MAFRTYIAVKGTQQKQFKGESTKTNRKDKWLEALDHGWKSQVAVDSDTGKPKGSVKMQPFSFVKEIGPSSPQFFQAHTTNEILEEVVVELVGRSEDGKKEIVVLRKTFWDAVVTDYETFTHNPTNNPKEHDLNHLERIGLRARKVKVEHPEASVEAVWDWNESPG